MVSKSETTFVQPLFPILNSSESTYCMNLDLDCIDYILAAFTVSLKYFTPFTELGKSLCLVSCFIGLSYLEAGNVILQATLIFLGFKLGFFNLYNFFIII